ncbi:MAG: family 20 glycosylhydrolase [Bacteroidales bacterium]|nr:family 20 glycosylhydrolase [Bacteroidales bacterium]
MKSKKKFCLLFFAIALFTNIYAQNTGIIPTPQRVEYQSGEMVWQQPVLFFASTCSNQNQIAEQLNELPDFKAKVVGNFSENTDNQYIIFKKVDHLENIPQFEEQAYTLEVSTNRISVQATTEQGLFYGLQSLKQLYRFHYRMYFTDNEHVVIPCMKITDYPQLEWRGWMDDLSRGPIATVDFIKKQIRTLAEFKLNCFTLYTENVFQSSKHHYAPTDGLTPAEIRELEAYAQQYHIELIGNQQCFAHFEKILAQPEFAHLADSRANLNPALKETYQFLEDILDEETACYTSPFFNINCDETEQLGSGAAAAYVKKIGAEEAYARHIIKVHKMLQAREKKTMMWADIVLKSKKISNKIPKNVTMLVWSYVPAESFRQMIAPVQEAGFDFWVVPGVSMWSTVFPSMDSYVKNIANFARDGWQMGARGLLNTAWNDSGEALLNSAWHGLAWGAEMAWKPITSIEKISADREREERLSSFNTNFNFQFFHFYNDENIIADFLHAVTKFENCSVPELYNTGSLWSYTPWQFFPPNLSTDALQNIREERFNTTKAIELEKLILSEEAQYENSEIIYCAMVAAQRMLNNLLLKKFQIDIYNLYEHPEAWGDQPQKRFEEDVDELNFWLQKSHDAHIYLWEQEYREYGKDVLNERYEELISKMIDLRQHVFIETSLRDRQLWLNLRTILNDTPIHYTLDGSTPTLSAPVFNDEIPINQSCTVRTLTTVKDVAEVYNSKELHVHRGMTAQAESHANYSTYRAEYSGGGSQALFDGETGSDSYRDGKWQGVQGEDVTVDYQWSDKQHISEIEVSFLQNYYDWILAPVEVEIYTMDGKSYQPVKKQRFDINQVTGNKRGTLKVTGLDLDVKSLRVVVKNPGVLPEGHGGAGAPSFIFLDEIFIR